MHVVGRKRTGMDSRRAVGACNEQVHLCTEVRVEHTALFLLNQMLAIMATKRITFPNAEGTDLAARLETPAGPPRAYVLFAHCFTCSKDLRAARTISAALCERGFAVMRFDFTGLGESEGDFADTNFSSNTHDLVAAAEFMEETYSAPTVLVGHSLGGAAVLQAAHDIPSVRAVATIGAPADPEHVTHLISEDIDTIKRTGKASVTLAGRPFTIKKQFLDDLQAQSMKQKISTLARALLIFHSPIDQTVGVENAARIYEAAKHPKSYVSLDQADHLLTDPADATYVAHVLAAWAVRYLDTDKTVPSRPEPDASADAPEDAVQAVTGPEGYRTPIQARHHALVGDEPASVGGEDTGPTPYEFLSAGLAACTTMTLQMYARRKGWPLDEAQVEVRHSKIHADDCAHCDTESGKIDRFTREVTVTGDLSDKQRERLLEIANKCPVHRTLHSEIDVQTDWA